MLWFDRIVENIDFSVVISRNHNVSRSRIWFVFWFAIPFERSVAVKFGCGWCSCFVGFGIKVVQVQTVRHVYIGSWIILLKLVKDKLGIGCKYRTCYHSIVSWNQKTQYILSKMGPIFMNLYRHYQNYFQITIEILKKQTLFVSW